ncbi:hypothetical protein WOLCODRAFT_106764 [Wolfiporia cocos MD-104 SS10]|uniref:Nuclear condensin complex subunit 3 C-terminal domain-containing protein n=1 Tax=Wolfiporia cocos (strain MD-104) TaxID=742152 RepID=A0A2H3IY70_WOLCO|nr:hypothetical protein WOLCODRAFT_106764 [Wolfiporia cocos MD-104 SS10]
MAKISDSKQSPYKSVALIFDQAQQSSTNHRKNCVALHKLQVAAITARSSSLRNTATKDADRTFDDIFLDMLTRVLIVKKGLAAADRVVGFVGAYVQYIMDKEAAVMSTSDNVQSSNTNSIAAEFVARLLSWLMKGIPARNKAVRYRSIQVITEIIAHINEADDMYATLHQGLIERTHDREPSIRAISIVALSRIVARKDAIILASDQAMILDVLLDSLQYDPSPEVRCTAMMNIPLISDTLPIILTRSRDVDPQIRKVLFSSLLSPALPCTKLTPGPSHLIPSRITHPRQLTLEQRESIVYCGLNDRESAVQLAVSRMVAAWYVSVTYESALDNKDTIPCLVEFVKLFDISRPQGLNAAALALNTLFSLQVGLLGDVVFSSDFWRNLTPETAFIARVFVAHCHDCGKQGQPELSNLPSIKTLAYYLQESCNVLLDSIEDLEDAHLLARSDPVAKKALDDVELSRKKDEVLRREAVVAELLNLVKMCDCSDENGRRTMCAVIREMLAHELLPDDLIQPCVDVLKLTTTGERELVCIVVELVSGLQDNSRDDSQISQSLHNDVGSSSLNTTRSSFGGHTSRQAQESKDKSPEEQAEADAIDMRCLGICIALLKHVEGAFEDYMVMEGIATELIVPCVRRNGPALRERALLSLGLCCLISENMAKSSFQLFLSQVPDATEELKIQVLQVIFDLLMVYGEKLVQSSADVLSQVITFLMHTLEVEDSVEVQTVLTLGMSKLMLAGVVCDKRVLISLVALFISPATSNNPELRQCLAYFLPAYCYSSARNRTRMQSIVMDVYDIVQSTYIGLINPDEMTSPYQVGLMMVDWTNPRKMPTSIRDGQVNGGCTHIDLAIDILKAMYLPSRLDDDRKALCQLLGKLYIPATGIGEQSGSSNDLSFLMLSLLLEDIHGSVACDEITEWEKLLNRFYERFTKHFCARIRTIDEKQYVKEAPLRELCEFIGWTADVMEQSAECRVNCEDINR